MNNEHFIIITSKDSTLLNKLEEEMRSRKLDPRNYMKFNYGDTMVMYIKNLTQDQVVVTCFICKEMYADSNVIKMYIDMDGLSKWMNN